MLEPIMYEKFNEILNIGSSNVSKLAIFIFIIAGNYANDTFSCSLRHIIRDNMIAKHILGIFIVLIFRMLVDLISSKNTECKILAISIININLWYICINLILSNHEKNLSYFSCIIIFIL